MKPIVRRYRDDGPLAEALARALPLGERLDALLLTLAGMVALGLVLALGDGVGAGAIVAAVAFVLLAAAAGAPAADSPLAWLCPPLLRAFEYAVLIRVTAIADPGAMPACYALLGVLALHHYDMVYRLQHQSQPPPRWIGAVGGGWDGRVLAAVVLAAAGGGALGVALVVAAAALALVYVSESATAWRRYSAAGATGAGVDFNDEGLDQG